MGISEALYGQLYNRGIRVSVIVPSYIKTNIFSASKMKYPKMVVEDYGVEKIEEVHNEIIKDMERKAVAPKRAVRKYIAQIKENRLYIYDMKSILSIMALKGEPLKYEEYLVKVNKDMINTRIKSFVSKLG